MPANITQTVRPTAANLESPFYYLENFQTVLHWVLQHHRRLLSADEVQQLSQILSLPQQAQALLARMVMRKGELFRSDKLVYGEIGDIQAAAISLSTTDLVDHQPCLTPSELIHLLRREELLALCQRQFPDNNLGGNPSKSAINGWLQQCLPGDGMILKDYWPQATFNCLRLTCQPLLDRARLMFFGNLHQDWSEFVLTELGHQRYEVVAFSPQSSAFRRRDEVDAYLQMHTIARELEEGGEPEYLLSGLPPTQANPWLESRRQRLLFALAKVAESAANLDLATACYRDNPRPEAQVRYFRVMEKRADPAALLGELERAMGKVHQPEARLHLDRVKQRLMKKRGDKTHRQNPSANIPAIELILDRDHYSSVELAALDFLSRDDRPVFYVENQLLNSLLGLLLWPALFAPEPGAFFHPFQSGPADLYREDFVSRRPLIAAQLALLDGDSYPSVLRQRWREKQGITCNLISWSVMSEALLECALHCIPARDLKAIFQHMLLDLRQHRRGLPDLIQFDLPQQGYRLIEVKGPGDRLQDHQRLWLEFFRSRGIHIAVAQVSWRESSQ